jgi:DNA modification methylase
MTDAPTGAPLAAPIVMLDGKVTLYPGDCRDSIRLLADNSIDSCVCDPPYALVSIQKRFGGANAKPANDGDVYARASAGFMGKQWDTGETAFAAEFWAEVYRVLKPGAHVVAFSGTRTYHRMACAIEDAGFEIRDQLAWCYFSGFPKSHDVAKQMDKSAGHSAPMAGALKESTIGQVAKGTEYERTDKGAPITPGAVKWSGWGTALKPAWEPICFARKPLVGTVAANVMEHGTGALNIDGCRVGDSGGTATVAGDRHNTTVHAFGDGLGAQGGSIVDIGKGMWPANILTDGSDEVIAAFGDASDNVSRLYYSAKADKLDRIGSKHPTVKPVDLMQWLCRLVTPPGGTVLDPFAGSGSTGEAAWREGFTAILCERETEYQADIQERMRLADKGPATRKAKAIKQVASAGPLFGDNDNNPSGGGQADIRNVRGSATRIQP